MLKTGRINFSSVKILFFVFVFLLGATACTTDDQESQPEPRKEAGANTGGGGDSVTDEQKDGSNELSPVPSTGSTTGSDSPEQNTDSANTIIPAPNPATGNDSAGSSAGTDNNSDSGAGTTNSTTGSGTNPNTETTPGNSADGINQDSSNSSNPDTGTGGTNPDNGPDQSSGAGGSTGTDASPGTETSGDTGVNIDRRVSVAQVSLQVAADCSEFKANISRALIKRYTHIPSNPYYCGFPVFAPSPAPTAGVDSGSATGAGGGAADAAAPAGPDDVSQTNNQEAGVNEGDMVKADPDTGILYIGHGSHLIIADAFPPQDMNKIKEVDLGASVLDLYYDHPNKRVVVMTRYQAPYYILEPIVDASPVIYPPSKSGEVDVWFFDVSDPADPKVLDRLNIEGYYQSSRRIEGRVHMVTRVHNSFPIIATDSGFQQLLGNYRMAVNQSCDTSTEFDPDVILQDPEVMAARQSLAEKIDAMVASMDAQQFLPSAKRKSANAETDIPEFLSCNTVYFPGIETNLGMQVVTSMDTDGGNIGSSAIVNNSNLTYVSKENLYLGENSYNWSWDEASTNQLAIHKFSIAAGSDPAYLASGIVDGYANNSFNFSEHAGHLRVATTQRTWSIVAPNTGSIVRRNEVVNHLSVLQDDGEGKLSIVGEVRDLAKGETIRSVRYIGDKGFLVTFRNIDPLFTFDLSDPANPQVMGELKIPGFSTYMHPYDENHLLTIGREGDASGTGVGNDVQIQLIDISDMTQPVVVQKYTPDLPAGYSWSSAQYDHHAFTYYAPANLLAIPVQVYPSWYAVAQPFTGMIALKVTVDEITEIGRVDHSSLSFEFYCNNNRLLPTYQYYCDTSTGYHRYIRWAAPRRSVVMTSGDNVYLYTLSDVGMKAGEIGDLTVDLGSLLFPPQPYPWRVIPYGAGVDVVGGGGAVPTPVATVDTSAGIAVP